MIIKIIEKLLIPILFVLLINPIIRAETIYASSGSRYDIQNAVDLAQDGDTVIIPSGIYDFDGTVTIIDKNIHIKGAGKDNTILRKTGTGASKKDMFVAYMYGKKGITFSDFKLHDIYGPYYQVDSNEYTIGIRLYYGVWDFKIYDMEFEGFGFAGVRCGEYSGSDPSVTWWKQRGVIYDCRFINCYMPGLGYGVVTYGGQDKNWSEPLGLGSDWFVFVEDCYFENCRHCVACGQGGRYVARYNIVNGNRNDARAFDAHGYDPDNNAHSTRAWEIYGNDITLYGTNGGIGINGGDGVIWNNNVTGGGNCVYIHFTNTLEPPDYTYPCVEQIRDSYVWGNIKDGQAWHVSVLPTSVEELIQENRDYYEYEKPGYVPYAYPHPQRYNGTISAYASASPTTGTIPLTVSFTGNASGGISPYSYSWDFGDGGSSTLKNPSHIYSSQNSYTVILTVIDNNSNQSTDSLTITTSSVTDSYLLSLSTDLGAPATGSGGNINPSSGIYSYSQGTNVAIEALPNIDHRFSTWNGDVSASDIYNDQIIVNMDTDKSLLAYFCSKCGDVNGDLQITASDAQATFDIFLGRIANPTQCERENSDVNCDNHTTPGDAQAIFYKFLQNGDLPADCSGKIRAQTTPLFSNQIEKSPTTHLTLDNIQVNQDEYVFVPIIVENPLNIDAFGFDLQFSPEHLEYETFEMTELLKGFAQVDANQSEEGVIRVGGYSSIPLINPYPDVLIILVFKVKKQISDPISLIITNTYDDIRDATIKNGTITNRNKQERETIKSPQHEKIIRDY